MSDYDGEDAPYWDGLAAGKLLLPRCCGCRAWRWPADHRCGGCGTTAATGFAAFRSTLIIS